MRQLFSTTVAPVADYASPIWYLVVPESTLRLLEQAQRVRAQAIISSFRTVALAYRRGGSWGEAASAEAARSHASLLDWHTLPEPVPSPCQVGKESKEDQAIHVTLKDGSSPVQRPQGDRRRAYYTVCMHALVSKPKILIQGGNEAKEVATKAAYRTVDLFTDGSVRNEHVGIGIWSAHGSISRTVGRAARTNVHLTELEAIRVAVTLPTDTVLRLAKVRVFSDSRTALQSIMQPKRGDSQRLVKEVLQNLTGKDISLH